MTASGVRPNVTDEELARIPLIVDLDAHLVEPPDVWTSGCRPSTGTSDRTSSMLPMGKPKLDGGMYIEEPGAEGRRLPGGSTRTASTRSSG